VSGSGRRPTTTPGSGSTSTAFGRKASWTGARSRRRAPCAPEPGVDLVERGAPLGARHLELRELGAVELARHRDERGVALAPHARDDGRRAGAHGVAPGRRRPMRSHSAGGRRR
jgi:hypothetical protein